MAHDDEASLMEAQSSLRRGIERSRQALGRYRARLLVLRQAMEHQRVPHFATIPVSQGEQR